MLAFYGVVHGVAPAEEPPKEQADSRWESEKYSKLFGLFELLKVSAVVYVAVVIVLLEKRTRT